MRIVQLLSGRTVNGAVRHTLALSSALAARGHQVLLAHRPELDPGRLPPGVSAFSSDFRRTPADLRRTAVALRRFGAEVLHTHMSSAHAHGVLLRAWCGLPCVATAHKRRLQLHWAFNDFVIVYCQAAADYEHRVNLVPRRRLMVIPNFIDAGSFPRALPEARQEARARLGLNPDELVIGSVGHLVADKRQSDLIAAAAPLLAEGSRVRLVLVGEALEHGETCRVRAAAAGLGDRVRLMGPRSDVMRLLPGFDLYAMSSVLEEMPMAVLEAMAAGLPVVGTEVGGMAELVVHGQTGFLAHRGDVRALGARLGLLARDEALRRRMGEAGRARVLDRFALGPVVARIEAVLASAVARKSARVRPLAPRARLSGA